MNDLFSLQSEQLWHVAGWTMLHFLWTGTLMLLVGLALRLAFKHASPQLRYITSLGMLAVLAALPLVIAGGLIAQLPAMEAPEPSHSLLTSTAPPVMEVSPTPDEVEQAPFSMPILKPQVTGEERLSEPLVIPQEIATVETSEEANRWQQVVAHLPWLWLVGTPITFCLLASGLIGAERLRRASTPLTEGPLFAACVRLRDSLRVKRQVGLAICERVAAPLLVGIVRPLILLPPSALTGWSPEQVEMVLVHELAHVRRWDNLVNLLQRVVESLLFFHPAVWLMSRWVRRDREECCDAVVIRHTQNPQAYAELLVTLATHPPLAGLAMSQHPLTTRIRRILKLEDEPMRVSRNMFLIVGATLLALLVTVSIYNPQRTTAEEAGDKEPAVKESGEVDPETGAGEVSMEGESEPPADSPFPTLEEQKAADLAFNSLGMELETLNENELKRVKAMGYEGGLRVTNHVFNTSGDGPILGQESLQPGDLLFGLHVWPTVSLDDIRKILTRDDLDQLSPLKFYVIRQVHKTKRKGGYERADGRGGFGAGRGSEIVELENKLITERIQVNLEAWHKVLSRQESSKPGAVKDEPASGPRKLKVGDVVRVSATGVFPDRPINADYRIEEMGTIALGPTYGRVEIAGLPVLEAEKKIKIHLSEILEDVEVQVTLKLPVKGTAADARLRQEEAKLRQYQERLRQEEARLRQYQERRQQEEAKLRPYRERLRQEAEKIQQELQRQKELPEQESADVNRPSPKAEPNPYQSNNGTTKQNTTNLSPSDTATLLTSEYPPSVTSDAKPALRYDGKTFEEWRNYWRQELSISNRIEAVRAMVAFANASYGKEAVGEIIKIAEQYDWPQLQQSTATQPLFGAIQDAFYNQITDYKKLVAAFEHSEGELSSARRYWIPLLVPLGEHSSSEADQQAAAKLRDKFPELVKELEEKHTKEREGFERLRQPHLEEQGASPEKDAD